MKPAFWMYLYGYGCGAVFMKIVGTEWLKKDVLLLLAFTAVSVAGQILLERLLWGRQ